MADGLLAVRPGDITFAHIQAYVDEIVTVEDDAIVDAVRWVFDRARLVAEPSGAASVAAALARGTDAWSRDGAIAARDIAAPSWRSSAAATWKRRRSAGTSHRGRSHESA